MGFRGAVKGGGGFLNNVDGTITGYRFTTEAPGDGDSTDWVYLVPSVRVDGADEDVTQHLFLGGVDRYEISDDGLTVTHEDGSPVTIGKTVPATLFLVSLVEGGFPESKMPDLEAGDPLNLEAIIGTRCRFKQEKDEEGTKKRGKRKDKTTGKEYDRTNTVVATVHDLPTAKGKTNGKSATPANKGTKPASRPQDDDADEADIAELAATTLRKLLKENKGKPMPKGKLSLGITRALMGNDNRDAVREYLFDDDNLAGIDGVSYNKKKQELSLD